MSQEIITEIEGQRLKLTNLQKTLYPSVDISKAQFIQYYMTITPYILKYIEDRPLTLIRYPDGVNGKKFYSKTKPKWTPEWIKSYLIKHDSKEIDYLYLHNKASLIWMANLASLEIHATQFIVSNNHKPDHFIFDLDPDEGISFEDLKNTAFEIKSLLESNGYTSFVKTSGGKGLHIYVPILPLWSYKKVSTSIKELAKEFVQTNVKIYTLQLSKGKRVGKILIDIYRNHLGNTCVAPYSTRGKKEAPISMPITWDYLKNVDGSHHFNLLNYQEYLKEHGDAWSDWRAFETELHTERKQKKQVKFETHEADAYFKSAEQLDERMEEYTRKRDFTKTTEPTSKNKEQSRTNEFVVHLHNASNLHYDLRLEHEGTLWSWAIPKGLPSATGIKRLAIRTEDHPLQYLDFEGDIAKSNYGGGTMWIMDQGKVNWNDKIEDNSLKFSLHSTLVSGEYKMYRMKENQWLLEKLNNTAQSKKKYQPMLAESAKKIPKKGYSYEVKWDGIRALVYLENEEVTIYSRSGRDITNRFPEFQLPDKFKIEYGVFDAEIVVLDDMGKPEFHNVISRMHSKKAFKTQNKKSATLYLFDILNVDRIDLTGFSFTRRREILEVCVKKGNTLRLSDLFEDGNLLFKAIKSRKMEGIMAKKCGAKYCGGQRSENWLKIKCRFDDNALIVGYTIGKGDRSDVFGALHLAKKHANGYQYMGKVGTGFNMKNLKTIFNIIKNIPVTSKVISEAIEEPNRTVWIKDKLECEISYASMSSNNTYREPVFKKILPKKSH